MKIIKVYAENKTKEKYIVCQLSMLAHTHTHTHTKEETKHKLYRQTFTEINHIKNIKISKLTLLPLCEWSSASRRDSTGHFLEVNMTVSVLIKSSEHSRTI
jgi:hypothetical protein